MSKLCVYFYPAKQETDPEEAASLTLIDLYIPVKSASGKIGIPSIKSKVNMYGSEQVYLILFSNSAPCLGEEQRTGLLMTFRC